MPGDIDQHPVVGLFVAQEMALNLDIHIAAPEHADERIDQPADAVFLKPEQLAPRERDEAACLAVELVERQRALAFRRAHFHARDEAAEVPISLGGFDQDRESAGAEGWRGEGCKGTGARGACNRQLGADDGFDAGGRGGAMEARRAVDAVAIEQRDRGIAVARGLGDEGFR